MKRTLYCYILKETFTISFQSTIIIVYQIISMTDKERQVYLPHYCVALDTVCTHTNPSDCFIKYGSCKKRLNENYRVEKMIMTLHFAHFS